MSEYKPPSTHPDNIKPAIQSAKDTLSSCCDNVCQETSRICECASAGIRKNPLSSVIGAAFVGAAVCYLILENRHQPTLRDRYLPDSLSDARDSINDSVSSIINTLKFW